MTKYKKILIKRLSKVLGLKNTVLFSSCRNALCVLLLSLKLKENDEVIVQSFICDSLPNAIKEAGGKPVLVEVNKKTFNLDLNLVKKMINKNTKAIIFVHTYGNTRGIKEIKKLCDEHDLILIEDIAHALGASYKGKLAGTFGDYAIYSFTKQMINFGGGAIITNENVDKINEIKKTFVNKTSILTYPKRLFASLYETRAFFFSKILIDFARKKKDLKITNNLDSHYECNELEAYMVLKQLKNLKKMLFKRNRNHCLLLKNKVRTQKTDPGSSHNYLSFVFNTKKERDLMVEKSKLSLPPWPGSEISDKISFVPNNPEFGKRNLKKLIIDYKKTIGSNMSIK